MGVDFCQTTAKTLPLKWTRHDLLLLCVVIARLGALPAHRRRHLHSRECVSEVVLLKAMLEEMPVGQSSSLQLLEHRRLCVVQRCYLTQNGLTVVLQRSIRTQIRQRMHHISDIGIARQKLLCKSQLSQKAVIAADTLIPGIHFIKTTSGTLWNRRR